MASLGVPVTVRRSAALRPSKQLCLVLGGIGGALLLGSIGLWFWQSSEMTAVQKTIDEKESLATKGEQTARQLATVQTEAQATDAKLRYLETSVTPGLYIPSLLKQVEDLTRSTSLEFIGVRHTRETQPPPPTDKNSPEFKRYKSWPYDKEHIELDVRGSYWDVNRFIYRLNSFPKVLAVESVSQQPQEVKVGVSPKLIVKLKLTGFVFKDNGTQPIVGVGSTSNSPSLIGNGASSKMRAEQNKVMDSQAAPKKP